MAAMTISPRLYAAAVLLGALLAAGCGGADEPAAGEFRSQATAACERYNGALRGIAGAQSITEVTKVIDDADPLLRRLVADLEEIEAPDDLAAGYGRLIARAEDARRRLAGLRSAARAGDGARLRALGRRAQAADRETDRLARDLRLPACAKS